MPNTSSQPAACLKSCPRNWTVPGKRVKKSLDFGLPKNFLWWNCRGVEEGAWAEWIGAARSQPGSFIEIFLNNCTC